MIHFCLNLGKSQFLRKIIEKFHTIFVDLYVTFFVKAFLTLRHLKMN